jgi:uncharacterized protein
MAQPPSPRTAVRRNAARAEYDPVALLAVLDAGLVAHVGVCTPEGPVVLPMAYGRTSERLYLHGAVGNALLDHAVGNEVCVTVTVVDGLVVARTPFKNSMNYRCVVIRGVAAEVSDGREKRSALALISDHVTETWDAGRAPSDSDVRATRVLAVPLVEMSGKVRTGGPTDGAEDRAGPHWGGHIPLELRFGDPVPDADLAAGVPVPPGVARLAGRIAGPTR